MWSAPTNHKCSIMERFSAKLLFYFPVILYIFFVLPVGGSSSSRLETDKNGIYIFDNGNIEDGIKELDSVMVAFYSPKVWWIVVKEYPLWNIFVWSDFSSKFFWVSTYVIPLSLSSSGSLKSGHDCSKYFSKFNKNNKFHIQFKLTTQIFRLFFLIQCTSVWWGWSRKIEKRLQLNKTNKKC